MQTARIVLDFLAALMLATLPAALLYWLLIHPLAGFWRRLGPGPTYLVVVPVCVLFGYAIWSIREPLMSIHFGYRPLTIGLGAILYLAGAAWDLRVLRRLRFPILAGFPELSRRDPGKLLSEGPYSVVRHPRYLGALVGITGFTVIANYLALYVVVALTLPVGWLLIALEERELVARFGQEYEEYRRRVPRFFPRLKDLAALARRGG